MTLALLPERIRSKISVQENGCWLWTAMIDRDGYGRVRLPAPVREMWPAHRYVAFLVGVELGEHMHHAHNGCARHCVNPDHLEAIDASSHQHAHHVKTHCKHGHSLDDAYIVHSADGRTRRRCRPCDIKRISAIKKRHRLEE